MRLRKCCRRLPKYRNRKAYESHKMAKKKANKVVWEARFKVYEDFYCKKLRGEKDNYKIARLRERKSIDLT